MLRFSVVWVNNNNTNGDSSTWNEHYKRYILRHGKLLTNTFAMWIKQTEKMKDRERKSRIEGTLKELCNVLFALRYWCVKYTYSVFWGESFPMPFIANECHTEYIDILCQVRLCQHQFIHWIVWWKLVNHERWSIIRYASLNNVR